MSLIYSSLSKTGVLLLLSIILVGCHSSDKKKDEDIIYNQKLSKSLSKPLNLEQVSRSHLIPQAKEDLSNWSDFLTLQVEMEKFQHYSLRDLMDAESTVLKSVEKVKDSLPEQFKTTPIEARLNVLYTRSKMLNQYLKYQKNDTLELQKMGAGIYEAYENLEIQLNEVYLQDFSDFDFDIDRRQDSLQKAQKK